MSSAAVLRSRLLGHQLRGFRRRFLFRGLRTVPDHIRRPEYADTGTVTDSPPHVVLQSERSVDALRRAGQVARRSLEYACSLAEVGRSPLEIDALVHAHIIEKGGAYPAPLNYRGFPRSLCSAVNDEVCHGIPTDRPLEAGDVLKFDVSVYTSEGYFGDNCATVLVGGSDAADEDARRVQAGTAAALAAGMAACGPGGCLTAVGAAIEQVAGEFGLTSVDKFCGHGIGRQFHMAPFVQHFANDYRVQLKPGMVFTIEPMLCLGESDCRILDSDGWTVVTLDGKRAAQYEHTIAITEDGYEVLTAGDPALGF